jgi:hypothetical protein
MKKILLIALMIVCIVAALGLSACNSGDNTDNAGTQGGNTNAGTGDGTKTNTDTYKVYAPDGAPILALAKMMKDGAAVNGHKLEYTVASAKNIAASMDSLTGDSDADFVIAPTNTGVMQSINTNNYYLLGVTSWGNLYIVTTNDAYNALGEDKAAFLAQFAGKSISSIGTGQVPDLTIKYLLGDGSQGI